MPRSASDFNGHVIGQKPKKGPDMLYARSEFGCSTFKHDEDEVVVVSGGRGAENRAEILFISTGDWMPRKYCFFPLHRPMTKNQILNAKCLPIFFVVGSIQKEKGQVVLFSFQIEMKTKKK